MASWDHEGIIELFRRWRIERREPYFSLIQAALSETARKALRMLPQAARYFDEQTQQTFEKAHAEGRAAEKAVDIVEVLEARGLTLSAADRERILTTKDLETLTLWVRRAATTTTVSALFD